MDVELSIIMPFLNEAQTLASCIRKAHRYVQCYGVSGEIVVGDNGSSDGSQEIANGLREHGGPKGTTSFIPYLFRRFRQTCALLRKQAAPSSETHLEAKPL